MISAYPYAWNWIYDKLYITSNNRYEARGNHLTSSQVVRIDFFEIFAF